MQLSRFPNHVEVGFILWAGGLASDAANDAIVPFRLNPAWEGNAAFFLVVVSEALLRVKQETVRGYGACGASFHAQVTAVAALHDLLLLPVDRFRTACLSRRRLGA